MTPKTLGPSLAAKVANKAYLVNPELTGSMSEWPPQPHHLCSQGATVMSLMIK